MRLISANGKSAITGGVEADELQGEGKVVQGTRKDFLVWNRETLRCSQICSLNTL